MASPTTFADTERLLDWLKSDFAEVDFTPSQRSTAELAPNSTVDALALWLSSDLPTEQIDEHVADFQHVLMHDELASSTTGARLAAARHGEAEAGTTSRAGHAKVTKTRVTGDLLLRVATSLSGEGSIARAAKVNKMSSSQTTRYLSLQGLTPKGMRAAGQEADRINGLIRAFAAGKPVWIDRAPRTPMTGDKLLSIARALQSAGSISAAARANKMAPQAIAQYLSRGGLTRLGLSAAGEKADEIDRLVRAFTPGQLNRLQSNRPQMTADMLLSIATSLPAEGSIAAAATATNRLQSNRPQITADMLLSIATSLSAEGSIAAAATAINISTRLVEAHLRVKGLTEKGRIAAGEKADEIDRLVRAFYERPAETGENGTLLFGERGFGDHPKGEVLLEIAKRMLAGSSIVHAAKAVGLSLATLRRYLTRQGLTTRGVAAAGILTNRINRLIRESAKWWGTSNIGRSLEPPPSPLIAEAGNDGSDFEIDFDLPMEQIDEWMADLQLSLDHESLPRHAAAEGAASGGGGGKQTQRRITGDVLLRVARSLSTEGSITGAAKAHEVSPGSVMRYLKLKGLTPDGRALAGDHVGEIGRLIRKHVRSVIAGLGHIRPGRPAQRRRRVPEAPALSAATRSSEFRADPTHQAGGSAMTADSLLAVVRLSLDAPIAASAAQLGIPSRSVWRHLSLTGLTTEGRRLAGRYAPEIDALMASRLERVRLRYAGALAREPVSAERDDGVLRDEVIRSTEGSVQSQESDGDDLWQELITAIDFDAQSEDPLVDEGARVASDDTNAASLREIAGDFEHDASAISSPASRAGSDDETPAKRPRYQ